MDAAAHGRDDAESAVIVRAHALVTGVVDDLREEMLRHSGRVRADVKTDGTPVTSVDVATNERIVAAVADTFSGHGVVSEELSTHHAGAEWTWVVDPIDGTSNFTAGLPYWCVSIALLHHGEPVLALVDAPALDARYEARLGAGATRNGTAIAVSEPVDWRSGRNRHVPLMLTTATARRKRADVRLNPRVMGSAALDLCTVAEGVAAAAISLIPKVWDVAAGALLVTEAGGAFVTLEGEPLLPLRAGMDYAGRSTACAAGPDVDYVRELADHLTD